MSARAARLGAALAAALGGAGPAAGGEARTGIADAAHATSVGATLGAGPWRFVLYLRLEGGLDARGREALAAALAALARIPGAAVEVYLDPVDREAGVLAEALVAAPNEAARRALLASLRELELPRWVDPSAIARLLRATGASGGPRPGRAGASPAGRALLRRPPGVLAPQAAFFALADRHLEAREIDALAAGERTPTDEPSDARPRRPAAAFAGGALAWRSASIRVSVPPAGRARAALVDALPPYDAGRLRLRLEVEDDGPPPTPGAALLRRALAAADQPTRVALARGLLDAALPADAPGAVTFIQALGIDPASLGLLDGDAAVAAAGLAPTGSPAVLVDGAPAYGTDAIRRARPPSLRQRLMGPASP